MPFDGIVLRAAVSELNGLLSGGRIEKIFQTERDEIVLACHAAASHFRLLISASPVNPRIHLTTEKKANPLIAPPFSMVLRKHLQGARILGIEQSGYDRVVTLTTETRNEMGDLEEKRLVIEIMGRHSNIILLNSQGIIHDAIKHIDADVSRVREIMPARHYAQPPAQEKIAPPDITQSVLAMHFERCFSDKGVGAWLLSVISGFSPLLCDVLCAQSGISPKQTLETVSADARTKLFTATEHLCAQIAAENFTPAILGDGKDYHCLELVHTCKGVLRKFNTVNLMLDEYYTGRDRADRLRQRKQGVERVVCGGIERIGRKLAIYEEILRENVVYMQHKVYGDLLNGNLYALPEYAKEARLINYYEEDTPEVVIPLDFSKTVAQNARMYFQKYRKAKNSYENTLRLKEAALLELEYLQQVGVMLSHAQENEDVTEIRQELEEEGYLRPERKSSKEENHVAPVSAFLGGKPASKKSLRAKAARAKAQPKGKGNGACKQKGEGTQPMQFMTPDGYRILVGRNNRQNDRLTLRDSQPEDLWFHLHGAPGSHVILCTGEKRGVWSNQAILMAAGLAAWYSNSRETSKADVDYTKVKYIKKIPGGHPGMVTYTNYKTITVTPKDGQQILPHSVS